MTRNIEERIARRRVGGIARNDPKIRIRAFKKTIRGLLERCPACDLTDYQKGRYETLKLIDELVRGKL